MSDQQRTQDLYDYLVLCFANIRNPDGTINERALGRRLLGPAIDEESTRAQGEKGRAMAKRLREGKPLTLGELVSFIVGLQASGDGSKGQLLTAEEVLMALLKLVSLTPEERRQLGLPSGEKEVLFQQVLLNIWLDQKSQDYSKILKLYRTSIGLENNLENQHRPQKNLKAHIDRLIEETADRQLEYLREGRDRQELLRNLTDKTKREVQRILLKGGAGQLQFKSLGEEDYIQDYIRAYLPDAYIERLTKAVVENELLTQRFPIYIKTITTQECSPLPLTVSVQSLTQTGLLYAPLLQVKSDRSESSSQVLELQDKEIASQYAHQVTVHFYLRLPARYKPPRETQHIFVRLQRDDPQGQRIDFSISSTGIGGTLSHIIKIINNTLLSNLPGLSDYFPIAHDLVVEQEIIHNKVPSPVRAHTLAQLCRTKTLAKAMSASSAANQLVPYEQFAFGDRIGHGDYCGFDLVLCPATAALQARLRAIRYTGINPEQYLKELADRTLQQRCLQEAKHYVTAYPFSSFAQESYLRETLLHDLDDRPLPKTASYIRFEACLTIAETYLEEGLYRRAKIYLDAVGTALKPLSDAGLEWYERFSSKQQSDESDFEIFSGTLLVHFELCRALYFYLVDRATELGNQDYLPQYIPLDRNLPTFHKRLIEEAWNALNRAEKHLTIRLAKYFLIHEVSQGTFHPHYQFLSKIYFLRARILTFFPEVPYEDGRSPHRLPTDVNFSGQRTEREIYAGRSHLLEKARLYAASDGDTERYACYTAYQSWIYWMAHFVPALQRRDILPQNCQAWAQRLRDHALLAYTEIGRQCYYQIKEKSGVQEPFLPSVKNYEIGRIPAIIETRRGLPDSQPEDGEVLYLDMTFLALRKGWLKLKDGGETDEVIYLFGPKSSYLFFARGMYQLCSDEKAEFESDKPAKTVAEWDEKLELAYRLFSYSWAMADVGGMIEMVTPEPSAALATPISQRLRIRRNFTPSEANGYNKDVASIGDLYPNQVSEMTDLGQVFAAASACLRLYTAPPEQRERLSHDIHWLLQNLQKQNYCANQDVALQLCQQTRYNGHLTPYLDRCRQILQQESQQAQRRSTATLNVAFVMEQRKLLICRLFRALHEPES